MGWQEHIERGVDIIHSPYWLTAEGVPEGCKILTQEIQVAIENPGGLWELIKPEMWVWRPVSPIEWSCENGFKNITGEFGLKKESVDLIQPLLGKYDAQTIIASVVFASHGVGLKSILDPAGTEKQAEELTEVFNLSKKGAKSQGEIMTNIEALLSYNEGWQLLQSPEGRIKFFLEPTQRIIENPPLLAKAIQRVRSDWGDPWNEEHIIYPFNDSVALSLEHLFQNELGKQ